MPKMSDSSTKGTIGATDAVSGEGAAFADTEAAEQTESAISDRLVNQEADLNVSLNMELGMDDVEWREEFGYSEKTGSDENYLKKFINAENSMSFKNGINSSVTMGITQKAGACEFTESQTEGVKFDGSDFTMNQNYHASAKMEYANASAEVTNDVSNSVSTDGTIKSCVSTGSKIATEHGEVGTKVSALNSSSENSEEQSVETEVSYGMKLADGMKMKNSVSMQHTEKFSETEEFEEEVTDKIAFQSRIETDAEKTGIGKQVFAGMYNVTMKTAEAAMSESMTSSLKTAVRKEVGEEDNQEDLEEDIGKESAKENKEAEQEERKAEREEETEIKKEEQNAEQEAEQTEDEGWARVEKINAETEELEEIEENLGEIARKYSMDEELSTQELRQMDRELGVVEERIENRGENSEESSEQEAVNAEQSEEPEENYDYYYGMGY